jgi:hypothetical protein
MKQNIYELALTAQSACNSSGLLNSLTNDILPQIWDEAEAEGKGTDFVNEHPVVFMFLHQLMFLAGYEVFEEKHYKRWVECNQICREKAAAWQG